MILLRKAGYTYRSDGIVRSALKRTTMSIPSNRRVALLGTSRRDLRILINLLTGAETAKQGAVERRARVSFQVGLLSGFEPSLTLTANIKHVARLYRTDPSRFLEFVNFFLDDTSIINRPFKEISEESRRRIASVVGFGLPFDTYIIDYGRGGARTQRADPAIHALFEARIAASGLIASTSDLNFVKDYCDSALVFHDGNLEFIDDIDEATKRYRAITARAASDRDERPT